MTNILAIDPAWTLTEPSGVALVSSDSSGWRCVAVAPSYGQFVRLVDTAEVDWDERPLGSLPSAAKLLDAAERLLDRGSVDLVTIDMPVSLEPITGRRAADDAISTVWGSRWASTHSPDSTRPGKISDHLRAEFESLGYPLGTTAMEVGTIPALLEVYPHPALIVLMKADRRLQYKVQKAASYWKEATPNERRKNIVGIWREILVALDLTISGIKIELPEMPLRSNVALKRYEDAIDALTCAWVGIQYVDKECTPYGDTTGAIWTP